MRILYFFLLFSVQVFGADFTCYPRQFQYSDEDKAAFSICTKRGVAAGPDNMYKVQTECMNEFERNFRLQDDEHVAQCKVKIAIDEANAKKEKELEAQRYKKRLAEQGKLEQKQRQEMAEKAAARDAEIKAATDLKKAACGSDYHQLRIGMTLQRVEECIGKFSLYSEVHKAEGLMQRYRWCSSYSYNCTFFDLMDGKIIAWGSN